MRRALMAAALTAAAVVAAAGSPAVAGPTAADVRGFGSAQPAIGGCGPSALGADGVVTPEGSARGFATCVDLYYREGPIRFYERAGDGTVRPSEGTGFRGAVLAVTADSTATYVLFRAGKTLSVGKRTNSGAFSSRVVSTGTGFLGGADIVARDGRWFAVWSREIGAGSSRQDELFQAGTGVAPTRITANAVWEGAPTLAYDGATPVLAWVRRPAPFSGETDLWTADRVGGAWRSRLLSTVGGNNYGPDLAVAGGVRFLTWGRDDSVLVASDRGGSYTSHRFATRGSVPKVAATTTAGGTVDAVFVTYTANDAPFLAETRGTGGAVTGTWSGRHLTAPTPGTRFRSAAVGGVDGRATVTYRSDSTVFTIRQS